MRLLPQIAFLLVAIPATLAAQTAAPTGAPLPTTELTAVQSILAGSTLSIYGILDAYLGDTSAPKSGAPSSATAGGSIMSLDAGGYSANRLGFLGSEGIGHGLRINMDLENGFMSDTGAEATAGTLFNRQCWGGVSGGFGEVRFGRQNTILQTQLGNTDPFNGATFASFFNNFSGYASRFDNVLMYKSPIMSGVALQFQFAPGELATTKTGLNLYVASAEYTQGGLYLLANYQMQKSANTKVNVSSSFSCVAYDFGRAKVYGAFYRGNNINSVINGGTATENGGAPNVASTYSNIEGTWYNGYSLTGIVKVTRTVSLGGGYGWAKDQSGRGNNAFEPSLIGTMDVTRKLLLYTTWGRMQNSGGTYKNNTGAPTAGFLLQAAGPVDNKNTPAPGQNETGFQIGFRYLFGGKLL